MLRAYRPAPTLPGITPRPLYNPWVSVILPLDRTNLITNPSLEVNASNYTAVGGSVARSSAAQYHGTYSLAITPSAGTNSDGAFYGTVSLTSGTPYAYSAKVKVTGAGIGKQYALSVATTGGVDLHVTTFTATGRWQWIRGVYGETSTTTRRIYLRKVNHSAASVFYLDGLQVESCADGILDATTYIDGDQLGLLVGQQPPAYQWTGTPHGSTSSRSILTRAGGYLMPLNRYNFLLTAILGLGMAVPNNISVPYTVLDGARYLRTTKPPRTFTIAGRFQADDYFSYQQGMSDLRAALDRDLVPIQQPLVLMVEPQDDCGNVIGDFAQIQCIYAGGLEGADTNAPEEDVAPTFTMYVPFLLGGNAGAALTVQQTVTNANEILQRTPAGNWQALSTGLSGGVTTCFALVEGLNGWIWAGGLFTTAGGVASEAIAYWDGSAWNTPVSGTNAGGSIQTLALAPNGDIIAGGFFNTIGGVAANNIARWNGSAWTTLGTGTNGQVNAIAVAANGDIYAAGSFTTAGGGGANRIAKWNGSAWSALGTGLNGSGTALAIAANGQVYVGGGFTTANAVTVNYVARWNGTTFVSLGGGMDASVTALAIGPNGVVYAGGTFATAGGVSASRIAAWNGTAWSPLGSGVNNTVDVLRLDLNGNLLAGGDFTTAGGITLPDRVARWNGAAWLPMDVDLPGTATMTAIAVSRSGAITLGYNTSGSAIAAALTTAANGGPGYAYPRLVIKGPSSGTSRIYQIIDYTTGFGIWLNLTINAGETVTIDADPQNPSFFSTFQGDITSTVLPGSQPALLYLAPGNNSISFFAAASSVTATLSWPTRYNGVADLVN